MAEGIRAFTIASGETVSNAVQVLQYKVFALKIPAAFDSTAISFQGSEKPDGDFFDVYDQAGNQISITVSTSRVIGLDAAALEVAAIPYLKIVSNSSESADRTVLLMAKE